MLFYPDPTRRPERNASILRDQQDDTLVQTVMSNYEPFVQIFEKGKKKKKQSMSFFFLWSNLIYVTQVTKLILHRITRLQTALETFNDPLLASQSTVRDTAGSAIIYFYSLFDKKKRSSVTEAAQIAKLSVWF